MKILSVENLSRAFGGIKANSNISFEVEITEPEGMEISETHSDYTGYGVSCNGAVDGSIDVTVTGGTGVYTYEWSKRCGKINFI